MKINFELAMIKNENHLISLESFHKIILYFFFLMLYEEINLPNKHYSWKLSDSTLGSINSNGIFNSNTHVGVTELLVTDTSFELFIDS